MNINKIIVAMILAVSSSSAFADKMDCQGVYEGAYKLMRDRYEYTVVEMLKANPKSREAILEAYKQPNMMSEEGRHRAANAEAEKYFLLCENYNSGI